MNQPKITTQTANKLKDKYREKYLMFLKKAEIAMDADEHAKADSYYRAAEYCRVEAYRYFLIVQSNQCQ